MSHDEQRSDHGYRWLASGLGLGQYEAAFRENEIEADVLSDLTELDLAGC